MLKQRLLSYIEQHRKSSLYGVYQAFPDYPASEIDEMINHLQEEGWLRRNETQVINGEKCNFPCIIRSNKSPYQQSDLFS